MRHLPAALLLAAALATGCSGGADVASPSSPAPSPPAPSPAAGQRGDQPVELPAEAVEGVALLRDVRLGHDPGTDRIVFELEGAGAPAVRAEYADPDLLVDASGRVTEVAGSAVLRVSLQPASGVDLSGAELRRTYGGPDRLQGPAAGTTVVTEAARVEDFEAVLVWAVGVDREVPFEVLQLTDPSRVVVELDAP